MKAAFLSALFLCGSVLSLAGNISNATYVASGTPTATGVTVWDSVSGSGLALPVGGATTPATTISTSITATFANGTTSQCTFVGNSCTTSNGVTLAAPGGDTYLSQWQLVNGSGLTLNSLQISLSNGAFNPCIGSLLSSATCTSSTPGAGNARSIGNDLAPGGSVNAAVAYTNLVQLVGSTTNTSDLFQTATLDFTNGNSTAGFTAGTFNFYGDTDLLYILGSTGGGTVPEPTTVSMVGLALVGLAVYAKRR